MNNIFSTILKYLGQSSTYKGLSSVLAALGIIIKPELADAIIACALGVIGLINVIIDEQKTPLQKEAES